MPHASFSLLENLIAYGDDKHAARVSRPISGRVATTANGLIGMVAFTDDASVHADRWESHPEGDEILCVLEGRILMAVEGDDATDETVIESGQAFIVPRARWHRPRVLKPGRLLFFTPTAGTALRRHAPAAAGAESASAFPPVHSSEDRSHVL